MGTKLNKFNKVASEQGVIVVSVYHAPTSRVIDIAYRGLEVKQVNPRSAMRHVSYTEGNPFDEYSLNVGAKVLQVQAADVNEAIAANHIKQLAYAGVTDDGTGTEQGETFKG